MDKNKEFINWVIFDYNILDGFQFKTKWFGCYRDKCWINWYGLYYWDYEDLCKYCKREYTIERKRQENEYKDEKIRMTLKKMNDFRIKREKEIKFNLAMKKMKEWVWPIWFLFRILKALFITNNK